MDRLNNLQEDDFRNTSHLDFKFGELSNTSALHVGCLVFVGVDFNVWIIT